MDYSELHKAAFHGNVEFLKKAVTVKRPLFFLAQDNEGKAIFHVAAFYCMVEFMKEAMNILPKKILKKLLLITDENSYTPLHTAALRCHTSVIKCIREMYESLSWDDYDDEEVHVKPWLALSKYNETPLNLLLGQNEIDEKCAIEIMLMDPERVSCTIANKDGKTPLYHALEKNYNLVAENILKSSLAPTSIVRSTDFSEKINKSDENEILVLIYI